jgi:Domain of unknown function (DUF4442)
VPPAENAEALRRWVLRPWGLRAYLWGRLPLAAFAGLRVTCLDQERCRVSLPGGWRTRNPFRSTYFAAQLMAAEMSSGAPALILAREAPASVAFIVVEVRAVFDRRIQGPSVFEFDDVAGMRAAVGRAVEQAEPATYTARPVARTADGTVAARFEVTWSFKRRG